MTKSTIRTLHLLQLHFALAKCVRMRKFCQRNLPLATGDLEWADSVTEKPKAELLQIIV